METRKIIQINQLPLQEAVLERISNSISTYAAAGIIIEVVDFDGLIALVIITQSNLNIGNILNNKNLYELGKSVFSGIDEIKFKIIPSVFSLNVHNITIKWIEDKMKEFRVNKKDLVKQTAIDNASLGLILLGKIELSKPIRAMFFYYFLAFELNRNFREND